MKENLNRQPLFSMDPSTPEALPEHRALVSCLVDMYRYLGSFTAFETLQSLFIRGRIAGGDPYPWEVCRWKERHQAEDEHEQPLRDEDYPHIQPNDILAWCDPWDFGIEHHWNTYKEDEFKLILEDAFSYWAKKQPARRNEFAEALALHGMQLQ